MNYETSIKAENVTIFFDGRRIKTHADQTIASALIAAGVHIFGRSVKYHRPRGVFCSDGTCTSCMMRVNGVPNVKACVIQVEDGMKIESQNAFPSAKRDILSFLDKMHFLTPTGFQYRRFTQPQTLRSLFYTILKRFTGLGKYPAPDAPKWTSSKEVMETDIVVIGGGPAGLSAATYAAKSGARVSLIDDASQLGGHLVYSDKVKSSGKNPGCKGEEGVEDMIHTIEKFENIDVLLNSTVFGIYENKMLGIFQEDKLIQLSPRCVIIATGAYERNILFENNDLPGIMGARAVQRLINLYDVVPGVKAILVGSDDSAFDLGCQLIKAGAAVEAIVERNRDIQSSSPRVTEMRRKEIPILASHLLIGVRGRGRVRRAVVAPIDESGNPAPNSERKLDCDLICISDSLTPTYKLQFQVGCEMIYSSMSGFIPTHSESMETTVRGVYVVGDACRVGDVEKAVKEGIVAGMSAASSLGFEILDVENDLERAIRDLVQTRREGSAWKYGYHESMDMDRVMVCACEDVTLKDVIEAVKLGYNDMENLKRFTGVGTGPCQGLCCLTHLMEILARETGENPEELSLTTQRPPVKPIPFGVLAGG